jgi:hypothetical protein
MGAETPPEGADDEERRAEPAIPDAEPSDAEPSDAEPSDAEPPDAEPSDAEPSDDPTPTGPASLRRRLAGRWVWPVAVLWVALGAVLLARWASSDPAASSPAETSSGQLDVRVVDDEGRPVPEASVRVTVTHRERRFGAEGATDPDGRLRFLDLPAGEAEVVVEKAGYARGVETLELDPNGGLTIVLSEGRSLAGTVVTESGAPIPGATVIVELDPPADRPGTTWTAHADAEGRFHLETLPTFPLVLRAEARGYESLTIRLTDRDPPPLVLGRAGGISGIVIDTEDQPAVGATVVLGGSGVWPARSTQTDSGGRFAFRGVPAGVYEVSSRRGSLVSAPREGLSLESGGALDLRLVLEPGRTLHGTVVDAADDRPVGGAEISVTEESLFVAPRAIRASPQGEYVLEGLRDRAHRLSVRAEGFVPTTTVVTPGAAAVEVRLRRGGTLIGQVVDRRGMPIRGASLEIVGRLDNGMPIQTDGSETSFQSALLAATASGPAPVAPSGELGVTLGTVPPIPLDPGAAAAAPVLTPSGPLGTASPGLAEMPSAYLTDRHGEFRIRAVPPGELQVIARFPGHAPAISRPLLVVSDGEQDVTLTLDRAGRITGQTTDARGFPLASVRVEMQSETAPYPLVVLADDHGAFVFEEISGRTTLTAYPEGLPPIRETVTVGPDAHVEVTLAATGDLHTLHARTVDARGFPVPDVVVEVRSLRAQSPFRRTLRSAEDGTLVVGSLPAPPWRIEASAPGYPPLRRLLDEVPDREVSLVLAMGSTVAGVILDDRSGQGVADVQVRLEPVDGLASSRSTNIDGTFEFSSINIGTYTLIVRSHQHVSSRRSVAVVESEDRIELDPIRLDEAGSVAGQIVDQVGTPIAGAEVTAGEPPSWVGAVRSDPQGRFRLGGLTPGEVAITARHPAAGSSATLPATVYAGEETSARLIRLAERFDPARAELAGGRRTGLAVELLDTPTGVRVRSVAPGSSGERGGLHAGDRLLSIDGRPIDRAAVAAERFRGPVGIDVIVVVRRGGREHTLTVAREEILD